MYIFNIFRGVFYHSNQQQILKKHVPVQWNELHFPIKDTHQRIYNKGVATCHIITK